MDGGRRARAHLVTGGLPLLRGWDRRTTRCAYPWWVHTATWGGQTAKQNGAGFAQACARDAEDTRRCVDGRRGVRAPLATGGPRAMDVRGRRGDSIKQGSYAQGGLAGAGRQTNDCRCRDPAQTKRRGLLRRPRKRGRARLSASVSWEHGEELEVGNERLSKN